MGKLKSWLDGMKIWLSIITAALVVIWYFVQRAFKRGEKIGDIKRGASEDLKRVSEAEKGGDAEWLRKDLIRRSGNGGKP